MDYVELGWRQAIVLGAALEAGLLGAVSREAKTPQRVAGELSLDGRAVFTVMDALRETGILEEEEGAYLVSEEHRERLLDVDHPEYAGGRVLHNLDVISRWVSLPRILSTGRPDVDRTTPNFSGTQMMARAMRAGSGESADEVSDLILPRLPEGARILDIGGGSGANAESFAGRGASVTVLDRPEVFEVNGGYLAAADVAMVAGDFNDALPDTEGLFDCVYLGNTSHMYSPDENRALFAKMHASLAPGGYAVLREFVRGVEGDVPGEAAMFAVNMLVLTSRGATYSAGQYAGWLTEAGFENVEFAPIRGRTTALVFARRP